MANLKRCPQGHFYDGDRYGECPYCEPEARQENTGSQSDQTDSDQGDAGNVTKPVEDNVDVISPPKKRSGAVIALTLVTLLAVAAALFCLFQWQNAEQAREKAQASYEDKRKELKELEEELETELQEEVDSLQSQLEDAQAELERAQSQLEDAGGLVADLYGYGSDSYYSTTPVLVLEAGGSDGKIPIYFGKNGTVRFKESSSAIDGRWSSEWESNWTDVLVTPSSSAGQYTIHFSNDEDSAEFDVLVVVR